MTEINHAEAARIQKKTGAYIDELRHAMDLSHWEINVKVVEHPGDLEEGLGYVDTHPHRLLADIEIQLDLARRGGSDLRQTVCHELVHLHHRRTWDLVRLTLPGPLGFGYDLFWEPFRQSVEEFTDSIATAWAETLPLPSWEEN